MADLSWGIRVDNTFIVVGPKRSTSLDGWVRERQVRSWPGSMTRQRSSNGQAHSRRRYSRSASRGLSRSQARDARIGISGPAHRAPSTDRSSTRSSSLMSRSGRRAPAYIRTPSSSLGRSQARVPLLEMSGAAHRPPSTDRSSTRSSSLMSRSGRRIGAYIRQATAGADFRDAGSENEGVRKRSDSSKRSGSHSPETVPHRCCTCDFTGTEDTFVACTVCSSHACAEQTQPKSNIGSGHGEVTATGWSEFVPHHHISTPALMSGAARKRGAKKKRKQDKRLHAAEFELLHSESLNMHKCEGPAPVLSDQADTFLSRNNFPWSLALPFLFSLALCSIFSMCTHNVLGDLAISGSICLGQFASECEGGGFTAKAPAVTFEAYQDAIEGINGLFARSDELRTDFGTSRILEWDELRSRYTQILEYVKSISRSGGNLLEALEAVQIFEFHADLALFVERLEDHAHFVPSSAPALIPRSGFQDDMPNRDSATVNHQSLMPRVESSPQKLVDDIARREQPFDEARLLQQSRESNEALMSMMSLAVS